MKKRLVIIAALVGAAYYFPSDVVYFFEFFAEKIKDFALQLAQSETDFYSAVISFFVLLPIGAAIGYFLAWCKWRLSLPLSSVEPFFIPGDRQDCTKRLYQDLREARKKICIASYWLTHSNIIVTLRAAAQRRVSVQVVFDNSTPNTQALHQHFKDAGITFIESDADAERMHHKFIVIDNNVTWVGSANLTGMALSKNYENMMRIRSRHIARKYLAEFKHLMRELG